MRFLTNTHDPKDAKAKMYLAVEYHEAFDPQGRERAWQRHLDYLRDKIIGEPQGTEAYTVEQLKEMGMVGVYAKDGESDHVVDLPDHHPLTRDEVLKLLELAVTADTKLFNRIQCRLVQGVAGVTCPLQVDGEVADRINRLERIYVSFRGRPDSLSELADKLYSLMQGEAEADEQSSAG
jgi:hypothetical protein